MDTKTARIRALNDQLRQNFAEGIAVMTPAVAALGAEAVQRIVKTIAVFDDFCHANDPYEEHDFGTFEADGHMIMFKIDYFDRDLSMHSPDLLPKPSYRPFAKSKSSLVCLVFQPLASGAHFPMTTFGFAL